MGVFDSLEETREFFAKDKFATDNGMVVESYSDTEACTSVVLTDRHKNAYGGVMGGVMFTLADFAFAVLANKIHMLTVAQTVSINYLSAPKGEKLYARAHVRKDGKTSTVIIVDVTDDTGRDIAQFTGTGFKL